MSVTKKAFGEIGFEDEVVTDVDVGSATTEAEGTVVLATGLNDERDGAVATAATVKEVSDAAVKSVNGPGYADVTGKPDSNGNVEVGWIQYKNTDSGQNYKVIPAPKEFTTSKVGDIVRFKSEYLATVAGKQMLVSAVRVHTFPANSSTLASTTDVTNAVKNKQDNLTFDTTPTEDSTNPVTSGGILAAIEGAVDNVTATKSSAVSESEMLKTSVVNVSTASETKFQYTDYGDDVKSTTAILPSTGTTVTLATTDDIKDVLSAALVFKGTVTTKDELDAKTDMTNGDVYIVTETGIVYAYVEADKAWKELSNTVIDTSKFVKTVNGEGPSEGNIALIAGEGITISGTVIGVDDTHIKSVVVDLADSANDAGTASIAGALGAVQSSKMKLTLSADNALTVGTLSLQVNSKERASYTLPLVSGTLALTSNIPDQLTAGYGIKIDSNEVSVTPLDLKTFSPTPPSATGNQANHYGYEGTLANVIGTDDPYVTIKTIGFIRRFVASDFDSKTLYCRLLVHDGTTWQIAMQSTNAVAFNSVAVGAKFEPFKMELVDDQYDMLPITRVVRIVFVTDPDASATTWEKVGTRTTGQYSGALNDSMETLSFAPVMDIVYAVGLVTLSSVETLIDNRTDTEPIAGSDNLVTSGGVHSVTSSLVKTVNSVAVDENQNVDVAKITVSYERPDGYFETETVTPWLSGFHHGDNAQNRLCLRTIYNGPMFNPETGSYVQNEDYTIFYWLPADNEYSGDVTLANDKYVVKAVNGRNYEFFEDGNDLTLRGGDIPVSEGDTRTIETALNQCAQKSLTEEYDLTTLEGIQAALADVIPVLGGTVKTA